MFGVTVAWSLFDEIVTRFHHLRNYLLLQSDISLTFLDTINFLTQMTFSFNNSILLTFNNTWSHGRVQFIWIKKSALRRYAAYNTTIVRYFYTFTCRLCYLFILTNLKLMIAIKSLRTTSRAKFDWQFLTPHVIDFWISNLYYKFGIRYNCNKRDYGYCNINLN